MRSPFLLSVLLRTFEEKHTLQLHWAKKQRQALDFWREAVGEKYALFSSALKLRKTLQPSKLTLVVAVSQWEWKLELSHHQGAVLEKYKKRFPTLALNAVHFKYVPELPLVSNAPPPINSSSPLPPPSSKISQAHRKKNQSVAKLLSRLRATAALERTRLLEWKKKAAAELAKTKPDSPVSFALPPLKRSALRAQLDRRHPEFGIRSNFLNPPDELQPFELYE